MGKRVEIQAGEKRGKLTFISDAPDQVDSRPRRMGRFQCDCGREAVVQITRWRNGLAASCGCGQPGGYRAISVTHGMTGTPMYVCWKAMSQRCTPGYWVQKPRYTGVRRDPRWTTFEGFMENQPAGRPYVPGMALARFGDEGDYTPENTRWLTTSENAREAAERRMQKLPDGRFAADVARQNGIGSGTWSRRLHDGWSLEEAVMTPVNQPKRLRVADGRYASDVAKGNGISSRTWHDRVAAGWDVERAVTEPVRRRR